MSHYTCRKCDQRYDQCTCLIGPTLRPPPTQEETTAEINNVLKPWGLEAAHMFNQQFGDHVVIRKVGNVRRNVGKSPALCLSEILNAQT